MALTECRWSFLNTTGLKTLCLIHFWGWRNSLFPLLALWGNKNWPPSMKVKKLEIFQNKRGLKGCKWSSLNAPGTENTQSHSLLGLEEYPFPISRFMVRTPKETKDKRRFAARNAVGIITAGKRFCVKVRNICVEIHQF